MESSSKMSELTFISPHPHIKGMLQVRENSGALLGTMEMGGDGKYLFCAGQHTNWWRAPVLRSIADMLDKMNER